MVSKLADLDNWIDEENLEVNYGGKNDFKYNFDEHWKKEDNEFPIS